MIDIKSLTIDELTEYLLTIGEKKFRAGQIYEWLHRRKITDFEEMTNLSKDLRNKLKENCILTTLSTITVQESRLDGTRKYLFGLDDGNAVESVFMRYHHGNSVCVSSQVGCRMGCKFCASTLDGLERNLTSAEILDQVYSIERDTGERVSNLVIMGTGEPMDNYDNVIKFVKILSSENGLNISRRNITISTCGIVPGIMKLAEENMPVTLALSLHSTTDEKRKLLMPIAYKYSLEEVIPACKYYFEKTGRRVTFEYALVEGVNDRFEDADELSVIANAVEAHVNLIPVNPIKERDFKSTGANAVRAFQARLEKKKVAATVRREMGRDIDGACGQLRRKMRDSQ